MKRTFLKLIKHRVVAIQQDLALLLKKKDPILVNSAV